LLTGTAQELHRDPRAPQAGASSPWWKSRGAASAYDSPPGGETGRERPSRLPGRAFMSARLLVDREHDRAARGMQVRGGDLRNFFAKRGIRAVDPALDPVRPEVDRGENALIATPTDAGHQAAGFGFVHQVGDRAGRLAGRTTHRLAGQGNQLQARDRAERGRRPGPRLVLQSRQALTPEPRPPALDGARMHHIAPETGPCPNSTREFGALPLVQRHPDAGPPATEHATTASWHRGRHQTFRSARDRSAQPDFSGGISGSGH